MTPKERVEFIDNKFQGHLSKIERILNGQSFQTIGTKRKPRGIKLRTSENTVKALMKLPFINYSSPSDRWTKGQKEKSLYCFKAIFQIQIEGKKKGNQIIEERLLLVKADNLDKAEQKLKREFKNYEKPYLNASGQMVRWKFEEIVERHLTDYSDKHDFDKPIELFSKLKGRRLKKENIWTGD